MRAFSTTGSAPPADGEAKLGAPANQTRAAIATRFIAGGYFQLAAANFSANAPTTRLAYSPEQTNSPKPVWSVRSLQARDPVHVHPDAAIEETANWVDGISVLTKRGLLIPEILNTGIQLDLI